jgi:hypothetical protein
MNRRDLFKYLAAAGAAIAVPELWVPGERKIFLPPAGGWALAGEPPYMYTVHSSEVYSMELPSLTEIGMMISIFNTAGAEVHPGPGWRKMSELVSPSGEVRSTWIKTVATEWSHGDSKLLITAKPGTQYEFRVEGPYEEI